MFPSGGPPNSFKHSQAQTKGLGSLFVNTGIADSTEGADPSLNISNLFLSPILTNSGLKENDVTHNTIFPLSIDPLTNEEFQSPLRLLTPQGTYGSYSALTSDSTSWDFSSLASSSLPYCSHVQMPTSLAEMDLQTALTFLRCITHQVESQRLIAAVKSWGNDTTENVLAMDPLTPKTPSLEQHVSPLFRPWKPPMKFSSTPISPPSDPPMTSRQRDDAEQLEELLKELRPSQELPMWDSPEMSDVLFTSSASAAFKCLNSSAAPNHHPPRPPNAFILFRRHQQSCLKKVKPKLHLRIISKMVAKWWREDVEEKVKEHYRELALKAREEHGKIFPGYRYRPKPPKGRDRRKRMNELGGGEERKETVEKEEDDEAWQSVVNFEM